MDALPVTYTIAEFARAFHKSPRVISRMFRHGEIPGLRVGNSIVFTQEHYDQTVEILSAASPFTQKHNEHAPKLTGLTKTSRRRVS